MPAWTVSAGDHEPLAFLRDRKNVRINLICTGRPCQPFHPTLLDAVGRHRLGDQVQFLGKRSEEFRAVRFKRAKFFPSLLAGHSQSSLESLYHHKPVVGAEQSSIPETVGSAGYLFNPLDVDAMADALKRAWTDTALLAKLTANTERSFDRYRWDRALVTLTACHKHAAGLSTGEKAALDRALLADKPEDA